MPYISRSFNLIKDEGKFVIKSSLMVDKLTNEYQYYYALPNKLQAYFVKPFEFKVFNGIASYKMNKLGGPPLSFMLIGDTLDTATVDNMFDFINKFFKDASRKNLNVEAGQAYMYDIVINKSIQRVNELNDRAGEIFGDQSSSLLDRLIIQFNKLASVRNQFAIIESHGDMCLSNIIIHNDSLFFIDPRGLDSMWLDEYYDVAKLSHSILGGYDFIINDSAEIKNTYLIDKFYELVSNRNLDLNIVRLFEASLFLSMCPLHLENPNHVAKFLQKASDILDELEEK